jgi:hypothetical protein
MSRTDLLDTDLAQQPLELDNFKFLTPDDYPLALVGFKLKNLYDQKRISLSPKYNPLDVVHRISPCADNIMAFRGISILLSKSYLSLIQQLENFNKIEKVSRKVYQNLLGEFTLTCEDCYGYLNKGVYPIDGKCLNKISKTVDYDSLYTKIININDIHPMQSFSSFTIFILSNRGIISEKTSTK